MAKLIGLPICFAGVASATVPLEEVRTEWAKFKSQHGKFYNSDVEEQRRLKIFEDNLEYARTMNARGASYVLGVTPFADLTFDEFKSQFVGGFIPAPAANTTYFTKPPGMKLADSVDWTQKGAVTPVKNQARCGSCWTFSATGALEGAMAVAGRGLVSLSEQEIVSCDTGMIGGHGCNGGNPSQAMGWVKSNGICSETDVPYKCADQTSSECKNAQCASKSCKAVLKGGGFFSSGDVTGVASVGHTEEALEAAVSGQPVSVAIEADTKVFQLYTGGVLDNAACGQNLDHAVLAVGYGVDGDKKYWKVKNSWGNSWGEQGYIRLARGDPSVGSGGECGIRLMASYATVKKSSKLDVENTSGDCISDLVNIAKDFGEAGVALKGIVSDCTGDDRTKCQADVDQLLQQLTVAVQDVDKSTTSCGSHGPDCVAEIQKLSEAINAIDGPAKKMADECAGQHKNILQCAVDGGQVAIDVVSVGKEVADVVSICKKGINEVVV